MRVSLEGVGLMQWKLQRLIDDVPKKVASALYVEAELVMTRSKDEFVPVDHGTLKNNGHVGRPVIDSDGISVELGFGGPAAEYALAVHEHPSEYDPPTWQGKAIVFQPDGRGPKYLEKPMMEAVNGMADRIASGIDL
jgi:hypothetical protein